MLNTFAVTISPILYTSDGCFICFVHENSDICIGPSEVIKEISDKWEVFNLFDYREKNEVLHSSGLTFHKYYSRYMCLQTTKGHCQTSRKAD